MSERVFSTRWHAEAGVEAWRVLPEGATAAFRTDSFAASIRFVDAIAALVTGDIMPNLDVRPDGVTVLLRAFKDEYGMTTDELELARAISAAAAEQGLRPDPRAVQSLLVIPGAKDRTRIMPFWRAVLGYEPRPDSPDEDLVDPHDRLAPFWFEEMDELRADGAGSIHLVVWVPWDEIAARVQAGVDAGGRVVRHNTEEGFWTVADPAGNEIDIGATRGPEAAA